MQVIDKFSTFPWDALKTSAMVGIKLHIAALTFLSFVFVPSKNDTRTAEDLHKETDAKAH